MGGGNKDSVTTKKPQKSDALQIESYRINYK